MLNENKNVRDDDSIDLLKLFSALLRRLPIILLSIVVCAVVGFSYAKFFLPLEYTSSTYMYVKNSAEQDEKNSINQQDLQASKSLVSTYIVILQNNVVVKEVGDRLVGEFGADRVSEAFPVSGEGQISVSALKSAISMAADGDTEVLKISAQTKDPEISAAICDIYAKVAPSFLIRIVGAGSVEVIGDAEVPTSPSYPNIMKITMLAALVGLFCSAAVVILLYFLDKTVKDEEDFSAFSVPYLGEIAEIVTEEQKKKRRTIKRKKTSPEVSSAILSKCELPFYVSEAYRAIRTNLMFSLSTKDKNIVVVSSANASEGKSTTAANLAVTLAMMEAKVLLIDADLRRPVQHRYFELKNKCGLSEVLSRMKKLNDAVHRNAAENLDVLCSGACPPNPSELLGSSAMQELLEELEKQYDYIIIDTPPINLVSDALVLSPFTGGLLLVAHYRSTTRDDLEKAMQNLALTSTNVLGVVLNGKEHETSGYGYKKYGKYGKYSKYAYRYGAYGADVQTQTPDKKEESPKKSSSAAGNKK